MKQSLDGAMVNGNQKHRRPRVILALLAAVAVLAGCGPAKTNTTTAVTLPPGSEWMTPKLGSELAKLSEGLTGNMEKGDFASVSSHFSDKIKAALSDAKLKEAFDATVKPLGAFKSLQGSKVTNSPAGIVISTYAQHEVNTLRITYTWNKDKQLDGLWMNYAAAGEAPGSSPVTYSTGEGAADTEVTIGEHQLKGLLAMPSDKAKDARVIAILVQGSGQTDMDETIGAANNKVFRDLAQGLAQAGISTLRYNKRFYQAPDLAKNQGMGTIQAEVTDDFKAAIAYIKGNPALKDYTIAVIGHSLGGMLVPYLAVDNPDIKKAVAMAGSVRTLWDIIYDQNQAAIEQLATETSERKKELLDQVKVMTEEAKSVTQAGGKTILGLPDAYIASLNNLSLRETAAKLTLPILILQGSEDFQVSMTDFNSWKEALAGNPNAAYIEYPGLNHLFMKSTGEKTTEEYNTPANVDPQVIQDIAGFLKE